MTIVQRPRIAGTTLQPQSLIGAPIPRSEDARFLTGRGQFIDDIGLQGMLHASLYRSPVAHARIARIDTRRSRAMPGVHAVYTSADLGPSPAPIPMRVPPLPGYERCFLQFPLAAGKVRYVGEPVVLVVADSPYRAEDALGEIGIELEQLPSVTNWPAAGGSNVVHETAGTNVASSYRIGRGDIEAAFLTADYVRKETFRSQRHSAIPMETRGLVASWDGHRLQVWGAAKVPFANRRILASMLALPETAIDLIEVDIGGGFGVRGEFYPEDFLIPFAARTLGRPVKWIEDRREHFLTTNHSRDVECELAIACRSDGTIVGLDGSVFVDLGAYVRTNGSVPPSNVAAFLPGPYRIPSFACHVNVFVTNKTPIGSIRGPGRLEANFFRERLIDIAAADLGMDPAEMRRRNLLAAEELPFDPGNLVPGSRASPYDSGDYRQVLTQALANSRWNELRKLSGQLVDGWYHGVGLACFVESGGAGPKEHASLALLADGTIRLSVGCSALGQGHETTFAQVCGDSLGIAPDRIRVLHGSTTNLAEGFGTYAGRSAVMGGSAVLDAARNFIEALRPLAMDCLGHPNEALAWQGGAFRTADSKKSIDLAALAHHAAARGEQVEAPGSFSNAELTYSYGTNVAHVAVDPKTGRVKVIDYWAVEDVGRMINPLIVHGQMVGGLVQGLGATVLEELVYDSDGQLLTASLADYLLPTASDFERLHCVTVELAPATSNPLGVKAAGEGGVVAVAATVANAVAAALASPGARITALPLSPQRVWQALAATRDAEAAGDKRPEADSSGREQRPARP